MLRNSALPSGSESEFFATGIAATSHLETPMDFNPNFLTTHVGSMPHPGLGGLCRHLTDALDIPAWPQMTRRVFRESMYIQYSGGLPGLVVDAGREKIFFDTSRDLTPAYEAFY